MFLLVPRIKETTVFDDKYLDFHGWEPVKSCGHDDPRARQNSVFRTSMSLVQTPHKSLVFFLSFALVIMFLFKIKPNKATTFVEANQANHLSK